MSRDTNQAADGDSGSWVVRDGKLCGYIFCRVVGLPLAYMLPIEPVIKDITRIFSSDTSAIVAIPGDDYTIPLEVRTVIPAEEVNVHTLIQTHADNTPDNDLGPSPRSARSGNMPLPGLPSTLDTLDTLDSHEPSLASAWDKSYILSFGTFNSGVL